MSEKQKLIRIVIGVILVIAIIVGMDHLFQMGGGIRSADSVENVDSSGALQNGNYVRYLKAKWNTDLLTDDTGEMIVYQSDGTYEFNWDKAKEVLGRDADLISEAEYRALAGFYLAIDDEDIDDFILECLNSGEDKILYVGSDPSLKNSNYRRWTVNEEKLDNILLFINLTSNQILESEKTALASFKKSRSDEEFTLFEGYQSMNFDVLQRAALLSSLKEIKEFHDDLDSNKPHLNITTEENYGGRDIILEYYGNQEGSNYFVTKGTCTATVLGTVEGSGIRLVSTDLAENAILSRLDADRTILDRIREAAAEYVVGSVRDEGINFALEEIRVLKEARMYADLNCRAVYTTYDSYNLQDIVSVQMTLGADTDKRVEKLNAEFDEDLTVQELIDAPQDFEELKSKDIDSWIFALEYRQ